MTISEVPMVALTLSRIEVEQILSEITDPEAGGIDLFIGTTRNHSGGRKVKFLEYEAYEQMAIQIMERLEKEARSRWILQKVVMVHRLGRVPVEEASVVIGVSSAHRKEAFEACRFLIDSLKREVPIWKREHFEDGTVEWSGQQQTLNPQHQTQNTEHRTLNTEH